MKKYVKGNFPVLLIVLLVALLLASVTYAWFVRISQTNANEMQMRIINDSIALVETDEEDFALVNEEGFVVKDDELAARALSVPSDKARFRALLKNTSEDTIYFDEIGLSKPIVLEPNATPEVGVDYDEIPKEIPDDGFYYYGTQLRVNLVGLYTGTETQLKDGIGDAKKLYEPDYVDDSISFLKPTEDAGMLLKYENGVIDAKKTELAKFGEKKLALEPNECLAVYIEVEFVESGENQNAYKLFGREGTGELCRRSIYVILN